MFKKENDPKAALVLPLLSYIDFFKPTYVILENVANILQWKLHNPVDTAMEGIPMGGVRFLMSALVALGY